MANPYCDFLPPGLADNNIAIQKLAYSMALSHSYATNSARIENVTYCIWNYILLALTQERADHIIIPQHVMEFVGDETDDSADTSMHTEAIANDNKLYPDFAIIRIALEGPEIPNINLHSWRDLFAKLRRSPVPALVEVKRPASRRNDKKAATELRVSLREAMADVLMQAFYLFSDVDLHQERIILIVGSGEWWRWRLATRQQIFDSVEKIRAMEDYNHDVEMMFVLRPLAEGAKKDLDTAYKGKVKAQELPDRQRSQRQAERKVTESFPEINESSGKCKARRGGQGSSNDEGQPGDPSDQPGDESVVDDINDAYPLDGYWSLKLKLWTNASNQRLYLVHKSLGEM